MRCTHTANCVVLNEFEAGGIQFAVLWGMSDVSPGRICKFNSAAGANVQSCGDYLAPPPSLLPQLLAALGKFANSILPFTRNEYHKIGFEPWSESWILVSLVGPLIHSLHWDSGKYSENLSKFTFDNCSSFAVGSSQ